MRILNLTTAIPSKYGTGADIASQHFINAMKALGHSVSVVGYRRWGDHHVYSDDTIVVGERHIETKAAGYTPLFWAAIALSQQLPYTSAKYYSKQYVNVVQSLLANNHYDVIVLDHSSQLYWLKSTLVKHGKVAVLAHNLEHEVYQDRLKDASSILAKQVYQRESRLIKWIENDLAATSKAIWTLSPRDASYFTQTNKQSIVQSFELPSTSTQPIDPSHPKTYDIGMVGSWIWKPNGDGLRYFFENVYPHLPSHMSIRVAGRGAEWLNGKYPNVDYVGFVEDDVQFLAEARTVAISSMRGGGVQIKTLDAIGLGLPVVATPYALRGVSTIPLTVQSVESPEQFAERLQVAVAQPVTPDALESVKTWVQNRYTQFLHTFDTALNTVAN